MILMKPHLITELPLHKSFVSPDKIKEECEEDYVCSSSSVEEEDAPLDLRVNCGRVSPARDSGTESDDPDEKLILQTEGGYKPFKKDLIKRCEFIFFCKIFSIKLCNLKSI